MESRLKDKYDGEVKSFLMDALEHKNVMQVPEPGKITVNIGVGKVKENLKALESAIRDLRTVTGQAPLVTQAKKSAANFKLREGQKIGCKVTLRGQKMYGPLDKLMNAVLPRVCDFRGVSKTALDGRGNYSLGIKEQLIFPEIEYDEVDVSRGMNIAIVTTAKADEEAKVLLEKMGMSFTKE